jgi:type II restriction enzyme
MGLSASNLAAAINRLSRDEWFEYLHQQLNGSRVRVRSVTLPEGPVETVRRTSDGVERVVTISSSMLWRVANAIEEGLPFQIDRIVGASYNARSLLEALLARTPEFYVCRPGRIHRRGGVETVEAGHKHLIWLPKTPHQSGIAVEHVTSQELTIVETPHTVVYETVRIDSQGQASDDKLENLRRHIQIQLSLAEIGESLGYRSWIAANDRNHDYRGGKIRDLPYIVDDLAQERVLSSYPEAQKKAEFIDLLWFSDTHVPMVVEVEHSTGITSGLTRMLAFFERAPRLRDMRFVVASPDDFREEFIRKSNEPQFQPLNPRFLPYSAVEELLYLCRNRHLSHDSVREGFIDLFVEKN